MVDPEIVSKLDIFKSLTHEEIKIISQRLLIEEYPAQGEIFRENQIGDGSMYIVVDGAIKIAKKQKMDNVVLANIKPGEFFGEMAMLMPAPRSASATAIKPSKVVRLADSDYNSFKKDYPSIVVKLNEIFIKVLVQRLRDADKKLVRDGLGYGEI